MNASDTPETDAEVQRSLMGMWTCEAADFARDLERQRNRAHNLIQAIEQHYRQKSPPTYSASTLAKLIGEWRDGK